MWGDIFAQIAAGFTGEGGPFFPGVVVDETAAVVRHGSVVTPGTPRRRDCTVQVDAATDAMRRDADFTEQDVRLLILSATLTGDMDTKARVQVSSGPNAGTYSVRSVARDPAGIGWECRGRRDA